MKYTYAYKTSDGARHEETMEAESREAVFASLREKGIKAIKVVAADGSKANGEVRGYRLRTVVLVGVIAAVLAGRRTTANTRRGCLSRSRPLVCCSSSALRASRSSVVARNDLNLTRYS